jgi:hypothetical protein
MLTNEQLDRLDANFSLETWNAIKAENEQPLNCSSDASNTIQHSKCRALYGELIEQTNFLNSRKDRDFLHAQAALLRVRMTRPKLSGFIDELGITARNNPALKMFAYNLLS